MYFQKSKKLFFDRKYISDIHYSTTIKQYKRNNRYNYIYNNNQLQTKYSHTYNYYIYKIQQKIRKFKTKNRNLFYLIKYFINLIILKPILLSSMNLMIELEIFQSSEYEPILNLKRIENPLHIYLNEQKADQSLFIKEDNYLKFKCQSDSCKIKLIWENELPINKEEEKKE